MSDGFLQDRSPEAIDALREEALADIHEQNERRRREEEGLHHKYDVTKRSTGQRVTDCFVLVPSKDPTARKALAAYADATDNPHLAADLRAWVASIEE